MNILLKISLIFKFMFDKTIPFREKWWIVIPVIYILSPIDLIPEPILGFGFIDDIVVLGFLISIVNEKTRKYYGDDINNKNNKDENNKDKIVENVEYEVHEDEDK